MIASYLVMALGVAGLLMALVLTVLGVRRAKAALVQWVKVPPG